MPKGGAAGDLEDGGKEGRMLGRPDRVALFPFSPEQGQPPKVGLAEELGQ